MDVLGLHHGVELRSRHEVRLLTFDLRSNVEDRLRHLLHGLFLDLLLMDLANFAGVHALHFFVRGLSSAASLLAGTTSNDQEAAEAARKSQEETAECREDEENDAGVQANNGTSIFGGSGLVSSIESLALLDGSRNSLQFLFLVDGNRDDNLQGLFVGINGTSESSVGNSDVVPVAVSLALVIIQHKGHDVGLNIFDVIFALAIKVKVDGHITEGLFEYDLHANERIVSLGTNTNGHAELI